MRSILLSLVLLTVLTPPARAAEITVSAAASLTNAFTEVKDAFMRKHAGDSVVTNFAASNPLLKQMEEGAPVDVFASADQKTMDDAAAKNLIVPSTRRNFALNGLVLIVPAGEKNRIASAADLNKKEVERIAIGNPASVPAGRYARQALTSANLWDGLQAKFIMGESVRQTLDYVSRGEVQAGIVYATDARQAGDKVIVAAVLSGHDPVSYPIAVTKNAGTSRAAQAFVDFVLSKEGQEILAKYGFSRP